MLLAQAGCVFMGLILYISGVLARANHICALKGSSVELPCSARHPTSSMKWYTVLWDETETVLNELSADGNRVSYNKSEDSHPTLTINNLTDSDANLYCCGETTEKTYHCRKNAIRLYVSDLQVKVIPATEGQTVTLMCNTSCPLTENPAAYIWYRNREFRYQDWSPWYQQLVSSDKAVRYSCAIKGYEGLRAPEVSVDFVTPTCFNVTYAKGRMCSYKQTSVDEPCSITYPTEVRVQRTSESPVSLTCTTSCPLTDLKPAYRWYQNRQLNRQTESQQFSVSHGTGSFSCAVKGFEDLLSDEVCSEDENCWSVNYVSRRICVLKGSSVNISSKYSHPASKKPKSKLWYKVKRSGKKEVEELMRASDCVEYHDDMKNHHILRINNLRKSDSAEYTFRLEQQDGTWKQSDFSGVTLVVTGLKVKIHPAVVTEGQRVTLTCSTSCPLADNTTYIWYLNSRPLTLPENQNKHLVLDPVSSQQAGNYCCAVETGRKYINSIERSLTVINIKGKHTAAAAAAAVCAALLLILLLVVFLWVRKRTSCKSTKTEATANIEQLIPGPVYENISAQPAEPEELHYSRVHFSKTQTVPLYSTVQPHQPQEQEHVAYAAVNFRSKTTSE
ncbi:uncharacterized protein LOC119898646 isoform X2 [Micropterus salmoides]|uniref:uncharacterized protein LOC119898646 isoform X2 n=1 Tax=Micropterus salmoides TaxID=27706 RepID=UPI0018EA4270|nr:uncharacterized protein LOC119898646 isoform X2 [Micropterus salmoides]